MDQIDVRVHKEIKDYREKFYGLSARQWLGIILALAVCVPVYILLSMISLPSDLIQIIVIILSVPFLSFGFIRIQEMDAEKILKYIWRGQTMLYKPLIYKTEKTIAKEKEFYNSLSGFTKFKMSFSKKKKRKIKEQLKEYLNLPPEEVFEEEEDNTDKNIKLSRSEIKKMKKENARKENSESLKSMKTKLSREERKALKKEAKLQKKLAKVEKKAIKKGLIIPVDKDEQEEIVEEVHNDVQETISNDSEMVIDEPTSTIEELQVEEEKEIKPVIEEVSQVEIEKPIDTVVTETESIKEVAQNKDVNNDDENKSNDNSNPLGELSEEEIKMLMALRSVKKGE